MFLPLFVSLSVFLIVDQISPPDGKYPKSFNWSLVAADIRQIPVFKAMRKHLSVYLPMIQVAIFAIGGVSKRQHIV